MKPSLASLYMTLGRVKASERKMTSGWRLLIWEIRYSQKAKGLVWGLSTRKMRTP